MKKSIFELITEYAITESVNCIVRQDDKYKQIQKKIDNLTNEFALLTNFLLLVMRAVTVMEK